VRHVIHFALATLTTLGLTPAHAAGQSARATDVVVDVSWDRNSLPPTLFAFHTVNPGETLEFPIVNHDGWVRGLRADVSVPVARGRHVIASVKGLYGRTGRRQDVSCEAGSFDTHFCDVLPLVDRNPNPQAFTRENLFGSGNSGITYDTNRRVTEWGGGLEVAIRHTGLKVGAAYRRTDQDITIGATDHVYGTTLDYTEALNGGFLGGYAGVKGAHGVGSSMWVGIDADYGLYWARSTYAGTMNTNAPWSPSESLSLTSTGTARIMAVKGFLEGAAGRTIIGAFVRLEWIKNQPEMAYNSFDREGSLVLFHGPNDGTRIDESLGWTYSVGVRLGFNR
jgi:hypothetical protein